MISQQLSMLSSILSGDMLPVDGGGVGGACCSQLAGGSVWVGDVTTDAPTLVQALWMDSKD